MSILTDYLEENRKIAYAFATENTEYNADGHAVISKDDEWWNETEWDELFKSLNKE